MIKLLNIKSRMTLSLSINIENPNAPNQEGNHSSENLRSQNKNVAQESF